MVKSQLDWLSRFFQERFHNELRLVQRHAEIYLVLPGERGSIVFDSFDHAFTASRQDPPFTHWDAAAEGWLSVLDSPLPSPGASTLIRPLIEIDSGFHRIHYDIPRLAYWMLTRVEEIGRTDLDSHQRFPSTASHAFRHHYLERPVVDEWLYLLAQVIERQWPNISLMRPSFSMVVSHDVDSPSRYAFATPQQLAARALGDLKRGEWYSATMAPWIRYGSSKRLHSADPANTFDWIMDLSEQHGLVSAFYFIGGQTHPPTDPDYQLEHPLIRQLLKRIHTRGHEIGLHPSYNTYLWPDRVRQEAERLKRVCSQENVGQLNFGGRMHYLRWRCPDTMLAADSAGMAYDCTLTYADRPGFRCGTSREYQAFDPVAKRELSLRIRPLVVMEKSVIATPYLGLGESVSALTKFISLKETCRKVGSPFSLLWHNTTLRRKQRSLYTAVLDSR